jgi:hypothetical protein
MLSVRMGIWRSPRDSMCARNGSADAKSKLMALARSMTWYGPPQQRFLGFSGWSAGHGIQDGLRSGTKSCRLDGGPHLSCPRPRSTPVSTRQAPRSHGAERKYYNVRVSPASRQIDVHPSHTRSISGLVLHILWSYRLKRHLETRSLWWHWHRVTGIGKGFHSPSTPRRGMVCSSAFAGACHCKPIERLRVNL